MPVQTNHRELTGLWSTILSFAVSRYEGTGTTRDQEIHHRMVARKDTKLNMASNVFSRMPSRIQISFGCSCTYRNRGPINFNMFLYSRDSPLLQLTFAFGTIENAKPFRLRDPSNAHLDQTVPALCLPFRYSLFHRALDGGIAYVTKNLRVCQNSYTIRWIELCCLLLCLRKCVSNIEVRSEP